MTNKLLKKMKDRAKPNVQGSDFRKKKVKLGQKEVSASATKTSFQSKVLHMPSQSLIEEKGEEVTSRNLTLKDLLTQLNHYSEGVRKDALIGIKELLTKFPYLLALHLGSILEKLLNIITDGDPAVRQALVSLFEYTIPQFELESLSAYFPIIRVYVLAGLTHMYNTVRMTSLAIVELWLNHFPSLIVPISDQLLPTYIVVLQSVATPAAVSSGSSKNTPTKKTTPAAVEKQSILNNLRKLLRALAEHHITDETHGPKHFQSGEIGTKKSAEAPLLVWSSSQQNEILMNHDYQVFLERQAAFFPHTYTTTSFVSQSPSTDPNPSTSSTQDSATTTSPSTSDTTTTPTHDPSTIAEPSTQDSWQFLRNFFNQLFPLIMNNWVEIVGSTQASSSSQSSVLNKLEVSYLEVLDTLLQILHFILELLGESSKSVKRKEIEKYMMPYFPIQSESADITLDINVHMCNVFAHFLESTTKNEQQVPLISSVVNFTISQLQNATQVKTYSHKLVGLIPVVRKLLSCVGNAQAQNLLQAFMFFDENSHPKTTAKRAIVEFLSEILQAHQSKTASYKPADKIANAAVLSLPKLLFKLSTNNLPTTQAIIKALALFGKGKSPIYETVQLPLVPFFFTLLKPSAKHPKGARVFGPFVKLPENLQQDTLDLLYYFPSLSSNLEKGLMACCLHPSVTAAVVSRVIEIVQHHFTRKHDVPVDHFVAFMAGLLVGVGQKFGGGPETTGKRKRETKGDDDIMEVTKEEVDAEKNKEEVTSKELVPEKVIDVCERACWSFSLVSGTKGIDSITKMVFPILCKTLEERPSIATQYCIVNLISSIYKSEIGTTWSTTENAPKLADSMQLRLPHTLAEYLLNLSTHGKSREKELTSCVVNLFILWPSVLASVLSIFTQYLHKDATKLWQIVEVLLACVAERELENTLMDEQCKKELLTTISVLKEPQFASASANTTVLGKLCSDVELLYRL